MGSSVKNEMRNTNNFNNLNYVSNAMVEQPEKFYSFDDIKKGKCW
jgi:hypothetical protein